MARGRCYHDENKFDMEKKLRRQSTATYKSPYLCGL